MMKKGEVGWGQILAMCIVVLLLLIWFFSVFPFLGKTIETISVCNEKGGVCQQTCMATRGETILATATTACEKEKGEGYLCCTSEAIKAQIEQEKIDIEQQKKEVYLEVSGKTKNYKKGDTIPLLVGREYDFIIHVGEDYPHKTLPCSLYVQDDSFDEIIVTGTEDIEGKDEKVTSFKDERNCEKGIKLEDVSFTANDVVKDLVLYFSSFERVEDSDDDPDTESSEDESVNMKLIPFKLDLKNQISISGFRHDYSWYNEVDLKVTCRDIKCTEVTYFIPLRYNDKGERVAESNSCQEGKMQTSDDDKPPTNKIDPEQFNVEGDDLIATFRLNKANPPKLYSEGTDALNMVINSYLCFEVKVQTSTPQGKVEEKIIRVLSPNYLSLDMSPPEISMANGAKIDCDDIIYGAGSGCKEVYYKFLEKKTVSQIDDENGWEKLGISLTLDQVKDSLLGESSCTSGNYRKAVADEAVENRFEIKSDDVVFAYTCVYGTDNADNSGEPVKKFFINWDIIKDKLKDEAKENLFESLLGNIIH